MTPITNYHYWRSRWCAARGTLILFGNANLNVVEHASHRPSQETLQSLAGHFRKPNPQGINYGSFFSGGTDGNFREGRSHPALCNNRSVRMATTAVTKCSSSERRSKLSICQLKTKRRIWTKTIYRHSNIVSGVRTVYSRSKGFLGMGSGRL